MGSKKRITVRLRSVNWLYLDRLASEADSNINAELNRVLDRLRHQSDAKVTPSLDVQGRVQ